MSIGGPHEVLPSHGPHCISEISIEASRCAFCTQPVEAA